tara:strand:- start:964 stop:1347 length:384 start_codon:yes stop_codon:yes gene_type:complete
MNEYSERFGTDFVTNKQSLNEISIVRSKGLKNKIAGYITKILQRKAKFEERKQTIIDNEKKLEEREKSRSQKSETILKVEPESTIEEPEMKENPSNDDSVPANEELDPIVDNEKTIAEEIIDEAKSE